MQEVTATPAQSVSDDAARRTHATVAAPPPAGTYSQAVSVGGLLFLAGQTPRLANGDRINDAPFEVQARQALDNLARVAEAAGASLTDAVKVTVYLKDPASQAAAFDGVYRRYIDTSVPPARTTVQSDLPGYQVEVDAIICIAAQNRSTDGHRGAAARQLTEVCDV
jgi:2-iminobutanoate/2-iminopropanoate deaminase